jgi:hypothetical protein
LIAVYLQERREEEISGLRKWTELRRNKRRGARVWVN